MFGSPGTTFFEHSPKNNTRSKYIRPVYSTYLHISSSRIKIKQSGGIRNAIKNILNNKSIALSGIICQGIRLKCDEDIAGFVCGKLNCLYSDTLIWTSSRAYF